MSIVRILAAMLAIALIGCASGEAWSSSSSAADKTSTRGSTGVLAASSTDDTGPPLDLHEQEGGDDENSADQEKAGAEESKDEPRKEKVAIPNREGEPVEFELELATTGAQIERGLMGRKEIDEHGGMLFVYTYSAERRFWMKNCLVDIDIIFLDSRGRVTATHEMKAQPLRQPGERMWEYEYRLKRYPSNRPAQFAIELKAGTVERLGVEVGDTIKLDRAKLVKIAREDLEREWRGDDRR